MAEGRHGAQVGMGRMLHAFEHGHDGVVGRCGVQAGAQRQLGTHAEAAARGVCLVAGHAGALVQAVAFGIERQLGLGGLLFDECLGIAGRGVGLAVAHQIGGNGVDVGIALLRQAVGHGSHGAGCHTVAGREAGLHIVDQILLGPGQGRGRLVRQSGSIPAFGAAAGQVELTRFLGGQAVARCVAGAAVTQAFDQVGTAIPLGSLLFIVLDDAGLEVEPVPGRNAAAHVVGEVQRRLGRLVLHGRLAHQKGVQGLHVLIRHAAEGRVGEGGVEVLAFAVHAVAHGALEGFIAPAADAGLQIGRDVAGVDGAEGAGHGQTARVGLAVGCRVADGAVAHGGQQPALGNLLGCEVGSGNG